METNKTKIDNLTKSVTEAAELTDAEAAGVAGGVGMQGSFRAPQTGNTLIDTIQGNGHVVSDVIKDDEYAE